MSGGSSAGPCSGALTGHASRGGCSEPPLLTSVETTSVEATSVELLLRVGLHDGGLSALSNFFNEEGVCDMADELLVFVVEL